MDATIDAGKKPAARGSSATSLSRVPTRRRSSPRSSAPSAAAAASLPAAKVAPKVAKAAVASGAPSGDPDRSSDSGSDGSSSGRRDDGIAQGDGAGGSHGSSYSSGGPGTYQPLVRRQIPDDPLGFREVRETVAPPAAPRKRKVKVVVRDPDFISQLSELDQFRTFPAYQPHGGTRGPRKPQVSGWRFQVGKGRKGEESSRKSGMDKLERRFKKKPYTFQNTGGIPAPVAALELFRQAKGHRWARCGENFDIASSTRAHLIVPDFIIRIIREQEWDFDPSLYAEGVIAPFPPNFYPRVGQNFATTFVRHRCTEIFPTSQMVDVLGGSFIYSSFIWFVHHYFAWGCNFMRVSQMWNDTTVPLVQWERQIHIDMTGDGGTELYEGSPELARVRRYRKGERPIFAVLFLENGCGMDVAEGAILSRPVAKEHVGKSIRMNAGAVFIAFAGMFHGSYIPPAGTDVMTARGRRIHVNFAKEKDDIPP